MSLSQSLKCANYHIILRLNVVNTAMSRRSRYNSYSQSGFWLTNLTYLSFKTL
jgi:hypothetical protein